MSVQCEAICLELSGTDDAFESLHCICTPDSETTEIDAKLLNLVVEDKRKGS
jgi:hypothetical protein